MTVLEKIGNTPLVEIKKIWDPDKTGIRIMAKLEGLNPGGSVKDRPAYYMLRDAIDTGKLTKDRIILEPTSGNTGIGMAMIAAALGYRIKLFMPECVSRERQEILIAYGAELEMTPGGEKTDGAIRRAFETVDKDPDKYYMPNQFENDSNWLSHYHTTAPELIRDTEDEMNVFVAGMGTTGTLMGCSKYFRDNDKNIMVVGIEPMPNHGIQGLKNMNESMVPKIFDRSLLNEKLNCTDNDAFQFARELALKEGLFCGISSGAAVWGAVKIAGDLPRGSTITVILPDRGERYLSTEVFKSSCALCPP
jgi:S-sulfo-L-cysteine synthase (O-acetyl-L-serine-dependent)